MSASPEEPVDESARPEDLLHEFRLGRLDAGYDLLGRQAPVRLWREILSSLREHPEVNLELVAHRTLKRSPDVVAALLDLVEATGTPQAGVVARAVAVIREEPAVSSRASILRDELLNRNDLELLLSGNDPVGALNLVLSHELGDQLGIIEAAATDGESRTLIFNALEGEYQRLLELGRSVRWTSGSYRYFLRHALADLALVAGLEGRTGDLAYRLLQQQVENPEENEELISHLPATTRSRFLNWALDRENANQHPGRTRFALKAAEQHLADVSSEAIASAVTAKDPDVIVDALLLAVIRDPGDNRFDSTIAEVANSAETVAAERLLRVVLDRAPARVRVDLLNADRRRLVFESVGEEADVVGKQIASALLATDDSAVGESLLVDLESLGRAARLSDSIFVDTAKQLYALTEKHPARGRGLLVAGVSGPRFRQAVWTVLPSFELNLRVAIFRRLLEIDDATSATVRTTDALRLTPPSDQVFLEVVVDEIARGRLTLDELGGLQGETADRLGEFAMNRLEIVKEELTIVEDIVERGRPAARDEVRTAIEPLVTQAMARAEGNDRLRTDFERLLIPGDEDVGSADESALVWPPEVDDEIKAVGGTLPRVASTPTIELSAGDVSPRLRYLAVLERRATSGEVGLRAAFGSVLDAYIDALGRAGDAGTAVTDLFTGGQLFKVAFGLSASTREALVRAALANGYEVEPGWLSHAQFGMWLSGIVSPALSSAASNPLTELAELRSMLTRTQAEAADLRHEARLAYVSDVREGLDHLELTIDGYVQLWRRLSRLGIAQIAALGEVVQREDLDPNRHDVLGDSASDRFVVRSAGVEVDGEVVIKARMEAELD